MRKKIILIAIGFTTIALLVVAANFLLSFTAFNTGHARGKPHDKTVSPSGRWRVTIYESPDSYYAHVQDLQTVPPHDIILGRIQAADIRWKNDDVAIIYGNEINVRTGKSWLERSVSPNKRWKIEVFSVAPVGRPYFPDDEKYYIKIADLDGKVPTYKMRVEVREIPGERIRWRSNNIVSVYGKVIDVRKNKPNATQR